jgi:hypothetical protein
MPSPVPVFCVCAPAVPSLGLVLLDEPELMPELEDALPRPESEITAKSIRPEVGFRITSSILPIVWPDVSLTCEPISLLPRSAWELPELRPVALRSLLPDCPLPEAEPERLASEPDEPVLPGADPEEVWLEPDDGPSESIAYAPVASAAEAAQASVYWINDFFISVSSWLLVKLRLRCEWRKRLCTVGPESGVTKWGGNLLCPD